MWNRRRNLFLWIGVRASSRIGRGFPLLLPVVEETVEEIHEFLSLCKPLFNIGKNPMRNIFFLSRTALELIREARELGPYTLIQVQSEEVNVDVRLI